MIDSQQIEFFRKKLQSQREQVLAEMSHHHPPTEPVNDLEEKADRAANSLVETRITEDDGNLLRKIEFALERLDAGTYRKCSHCGATIPLQRLKAKPSVSLCMACQKQKDSGQISTP